MLSCNKDVGHAQRMERWALLHCADMVIGHDVGVPQASAITTLLQETGTLCTNSDPINSSASPASCSSELTL